MMLILGQKYKKLNYFRKNLKKIEKKLNYFAYNSIFIRIFVSSNKGNNKQSINP